MDEMMKEDRTTEEIGIDSIDNAIDGLIVDLSMLKENLEKFQPQTVPGRAAKDSMMDIIESALEPYLADVVMDAENLA